MVYMRYTAECSVCKQSKASPRHVEGDGEEFSRYFICGECQGESSGLVGEARRLLDEWSGRIKLRRERRELVGRCRQVRRLLEELGCRTLEEVRELEEEV